METEIPSLPSLIQRLISPKINDYRSSYEEMRKQFSKCDDSFRNYVEKTKLFDMHDKSEADTNKSAKNFSTKEKLLKTGTMIKNQTEGLKEANRTANETERIVISVQSELKKNKETLQRSVKTVNFILYIKIFNNVLILEI